MEKKFISKFISLILCSLISTSGLAQHVSMVSVDSNQDSTEKPAQLIVPKDKVTEATLTEALPIIKKILSIHRCLKSSDGLRLMNFDATPGTDMTKYANPYDATIGLPTALMKYHDKSKCVRVQYIDQLSMPALNAIKLRAVYFADDSGEVSNYGYTFQKIEDGSWKIRGFERM